MSSPIEKGRMMVRALTLEDLNKAAKLGGPSTLSEKTLLEPAAGPKALLPRPNTPVAMVPHMYLKTAISVASRSVLYWWIRVHRKAIVLKTT